MVLLASQNFAIRRKLKRLHVSLSKWSLLWTVYFYSPSNVCALHVIYSLIFQLTFSIPTESTTWFTMIQPLCSVHFDHLILCSFSHIVFFFCFFLFSSFLIKFLCTFRSSQFKSHTLPFFGVKYRPLTGESTELRVFPKNAILILKGKTLNPSIVGVTSREKSSI